MQQDDSPSADAVSRIGIALAYIAIGAVLVIAAGWSLHIDIRNNWKFGCTFNEEIADGFMAAAVALAFVPIAIRLGIRHWALRWLVLPISLIISVSAALMSYSSTFGGSLDTVQNVTAANFQTATDLAEQRDIYAKVKSETGDIQALEDSKKNADAAVKTACRASKSEGCQSARQDVDAILTRLSNARMRDKAAAEIRRLEAKQENKSAPKQNLAWAKNIGTHFGLESTVVAARVYNAMMVLITVLTVMFASMLDPGIEAIWHGYKMLPSLRKEKQGGLRATSEIAAHMETKKKKSQKQPVLDIIRRDMQKDPQSFAGMAVTDLHKVYGVPKDVSLSTFKTWIADFIRQGWIVKETQNGKPTAWRRGNGRIKIVT